MPQATAAVMAVAEMAEEETKSTEIDSMPDRLKAVFCCPDSRRYRDGHTAGNIRRSCRRLFDGQVDQLTHNHNSYANCEYLAPKSKSR